MTIYKEFLGLNYCIYEPILDDPGAEGGNTLGYSFLSPYVYSDLISVNPNVTNMTSHQSSRTMVLLNLHRNGPHSYPTWKQIRTAENHLSRAQRKRNIFTYVEEPGSLLNSRQARFGNIQSFTEPVVVDSYKPVSLVGDVRVYNEKLNEFQNRSVELKTSFGNETAFFANSKVNDYFETIAETDENYEQLKELYLDGGLEDEGSPIDSFNMFVYRQSIYPKQQYAYLDDTRSRNYFVNTFWRSNRIDRKQENVILFENGLYSLSQDFVIPELSMWPLDDRRDFETRTAPALVPGSHTSPLVFKNDRYDFDIGGTNKDNADFGPGLLQNRFSSYYPGHWGILSGSPTMVDESPAVVMWPPSDLVTSNYLTASAEYSLLHTLKNMYSPLNPSGMEIRRAEFTGNREDPANHHFSNHTASLFNGTAAWDAPRQAGKEPFYDSYSDFSQDIKRKGKGFTKIPEFRISSHVSHYLENGLLEPLPSIFEISGGLSQNTTTETNDFFTILSNSDFLKHFDLIKKDHKDLAQEKIITLKCKGLKKFLPYKGFYPADRCVDIADQFYNSYKQKIKFIIPGAVDSIISLDPDFTEQFALKPFFTPMISPGILFNTIKSGVAVDFPLFFRDDVRYEREEIDGNAAEDDVLTFDFLDDMGRMGLKIGATDYSQVDDLDYLTQDAGVGALNNCLLFNTKRTREAGVFESIFSTRIPFESLVQPEKYLANNELVLQDPHPFALSSERMVCTWSGEGDSKYKKMISNFLAEIPETFLQDENLKTIASLEEQNPEFGNAISGNYYVMRIKMIKSRNKPNLMIEGADGLSVTPPQDVVDQGGNFTLNEKFSTRETITMYSRPSAFGFPSAGDGGLKQFGGVTMRLGSTWGYNFPYTPPYYHGDAWCDVIFRPTETKKYSVEEILAQVSEFPYYTRYWNVYWNDALRDVTGYRHDDEARFQVGSFGADLEGAGTVTGRDGVRGKYTGYEESPWNHLITSRSLNDEVSAQAVFSSHDPPTSWPNPGTDYNSWTHPAADSSWRICGPQSPLHVNNNAMQLDSSVNLFGKGIIRTKKSGTEIGETIEVASGETVRGKTRWIIQTKFETPILNFNEHTDLRDENLSIPHESFARSQVPRGMWHQYGKIPKENEGIYLQVDDIPSDWLRGVYRIPRNDPKVKSLADLVGFSKDKVRLGEVAGAKEISEAVVAVPFIEKDGTRQFFSIPREDISSCIEATRREVDPGTFVAGGPPKSGDSVYQMVKKMQKYVFPPSMDFVRHEEIDPFAMYIFEFKHNLTKQDLADIWQNLSPEIGTRMEEAEASISHELLAHELLGNGAITKNGTLDDNAEGNGIPSNIQWMIFKAKKRAKTNYFDKVVAKKGTTEDTSSQQLENAQGQTGDDSGVTYNWPYDFFSLVELVKIDAEVTFANIENDDKGQKTIKKVEKKNPMEVSKTRAVARGINIARGKGKSKK